MRRLERGASYVPLIIVLVLLVVAVVWAYVQTDKSQQLEQEIAKAEKSRNDESARRAATLLYLQQLGDRIGFGIDVETEDKPMAYRADIAKVNAFILEKLQNLKDKYVRKFPVSVYTFDDNGGVQRSEPEDGMVEVAYIASGKIPNSETLQGLYNLMDEAMGRMLFDVNRMVEEKKRAIADLNEQLAGKDTTIREKDQEIARLRGEIDNLTAQKAQSERDLSNQINDLQTQLRDAQEERDNIETQMKDQVAVLTNQILAKEQDIQKLKKRKLDIEVPIGPDGRVLAVTDDQGIAIIDRGKADHLPPNTTFDFYTVGKGAQKIYKGTGVVLDVESERARVRITSLVNPSNPIVAGDSFESLTYNPGEQLHFYLLGRTQKYGRSDAAARLKQLGQAVDDKVGIMTDYLVMGTPDGEDEDLRQTDAYKRAQELGIKVITEKQLSSFLNY